MMYPMIYEPRRLQATEKNLDDLFKAAKRGLEGDSLAYAAGMTPMELRQLQEFDSSVEHVIGMARAQTEMEMSEVVYKAAQEGDSKAALEMLKHRHGWVAKQQVNVDVNQTISITQALNEAQNRAMDAHFEIITQPGHTNDD